MKKEDLFTLAHSLSHDKLINHLEDVNFLNLVEIANREFLTSAFFYQLQKNNFFIENKDEELFLYLNEIFKLNTIRNTQIVEQLKEIVSLLNSKNIECLLLKGCASLVDEDYEHIGIRFLSDIDILVRPERINEAYSLLMQIGYYKTKEDIGFYDSHHHLCPIAKENMPVVVELHSRVIGEKSTIEHIPFSEETSSKSHNLDFLNTWVLNPTYKLYHTFLHTEYIDNNYNLKRLDLRHIYDFTVLAKKYNDKIDWNKLHQLVKSLKLQDNFQAYLYMCKELFNLITPLTIENEKVHSDYKMVLKSFELQGTIHGELYPLLPKLKSFYKKQRLKRIYHYEKDAYYPYYVLKHFIYQLKTYIFCKDCLKKFASEK